MILAIVFFANGQIAKGEVSTRVCMADGNRPLELVDVNTPYVYRDIMVGTRLTIIISSDANDFWSGDLVIMDESRDFGYLSARDFNEVTVDWSGSRLPAAGELARVWDWIRPTIQGFTFDILEEAEAGDWFIIDYTAISIGNCRAAFYDHSISWFEPVYNLEFSHVSTRDFDSNDLVDFADFAAFALNWRKNNCIHPGWCMGTDLNTDGYIDVQDLLLFAEYWLEITE
jgi:hypothetical protein